MADIYVEKPPQLRVHEVEPWTCRRVTHNRFKEGDDMAKRRSFSPAFKAQVVLELLSGTKTKAQICREHQLGTEVQSVDM